MDYSALGAETRFKGPYGTYQFRDYAGTGKTRCLMPRPLKASRLRSFTRYEVFTGKQVPHVVTGKLLDVSWSEHVPHDDFIHAQVRCRICPNCVALNSWIWAQAACSFHDNVLDDGGSSAAVTLTFSDFTFRRWWEADRDKRVLEFEAEGNLAEAEVLRLAIPPGRYFPNNREHIKLAMSGLGRELTLYNKRLRIHAARKPGILPIIKAWMAALEFGTKRGRPHLHVLYHLQGDERRCRLFRRFSARDWSTRVGFTKVKRVMTYAGCSYASKYIGKVYDAGYLEFIKRVEGRPRKGPLLTEDESVEYARLLAVVKCQRTRTRSSLAYRSNARPTTPVVSEGGKLASLQLVEAPPPGDDEYPITNSFCRECGSTDGCDCKEPLNPYTDHWEEHVAQFWAAVHDPPAGEDSDNGSEHRSEGEMPDPTE